MEKIKELHQKYINDELSIFEFVEELKKLDKEVLVEGLTYFLDV